MKTLRKKPRGRPLHWRHKRSIRKLEQERVEVFHGLAGVKRLSILRQPLPVRRRGTAD